MLEKNLIRAFYVMLFMQLQLSCSPKLKEYHPKEKENDYGCELNELPFTFTGISASLDFDSAFKDFSLDSIAEYNILYCQISSLEKNKDKYLGITVSPKDTSSNIFTNNKKYAYQIGKNTKDSIDRLSLRMPSGSFVTNCQSNSLVNYYTIFLFKKKGKVILSFMADTKKFNGLKPADYLKISSIIPILEYCNKEFDSKIVKQ